MSPGRNHRQGEVELSQALCDRNGWTVIEVITEKDSSASKLRFVEGRKVSDRGEGWRRMVELVRTGKADVVVARHYDRLYRTTRDLVELVDLAEETGVHLAARIGAAVAENETEMRVERQVLGHQRRRKSGRPFWSTRPFGFERDGTHREEEADAPAAGVPGCPGRCLPVVHREGLERSRAALATRQRVA
ncbi:recombinase family protein [Streptomyces sp. NPDC006356]